MFFIYQHTDITVFVCDKKKNRAFFMVIGNVFIFWFKKAIKSLSSFVTSLYHKVKLYNIKKNLTDLLKIFCLYFAVRYSF